MPVPINALPFSRVCSKLSQLPTKQYEFPDGFSMGVGIDRFRLGELFYQPSKFYDTSLVRPPTQPPPSPLHARPAPPCPRLCFPLSHAKPQPQNGVQPIQGAGAGGELLGIHTLVSQAISQCDPDLRSTLLASTLVTGGSTLTSGFVDRLGNEMAQMVSSVRRCFFVQGVRARCQCGQPAHAACPLSPCTFPATVQVQDLGTAAARRAPVRRLDRRVHPCVAWVLPPDVGVQARVRRERAVNRRAKVPLDPRSSSRAPRGMRTPSCIARKKFGLLRMRGAPRMVQR